MIHNEQYEKEKQRIIKQVIMEDQELIYLKAKKLQRHYLTRLVMVIKDGNPAPLWINERNNSLYHEIDKRIEARTQLITNHFNKHSNKI